MSPRHECYKIDTDQHQRIIWASDKRNTNTVTVVGAPPEAVSVKVNVRLTVWAGAAGVGLAAPGPSYTVVALKSGPRKGWKGGGEDGWSITEAGNTPSQGVPSGGFAGLRIVIGMGVIEKNCYGSSVSEDIVEQDIGESVQSS
jgi:hypothetical protein